MFDDYLRLFVDTDYPAFIDKYLNTKTLNRLKEITQFCGCDYTKLYSPLFLYTRFDHSLVVAHMTWHFTHDKVQTIAALFHDAGTPCFAHCIDYVFDDYINQESSEKDIADVIRYDKELMLYLNEDNISLDMLTEMDNFPILENKSPQLCTDRLDGVLHTCYIWLHTHELNQIKKVYDDIVVLTNEYGEKEIGFKTLEVAEEFVDMVFTYSKELQGNTDKYVMKYISEIVKLAFQKKIITLEDLYIKKEQELVNIFNDNFPTWETFCNSLSIIKTDKQPSNFFISFDTKKRNAIPLVYASENTRISNISNTAQKMYENLEQYQDSKFAYIDEIYIITENDMMKRNSLYE